MFDGPVRGGNRGGAAEFKWSDVSADKDRENYLGHSINAPTGRWQKNKDVHWYNRDQNLSAAEKAEEIRKIKEAEADALAVALGFKPAPKPGEVSNVPVTASITNATSGSNAIEGAADAATGSNAIPVVEPGAALLAIGDAAAVEEQRRLREEKRRRKEEKRAKKELKRAKKAEKAKRREEEDRHHNYGMIRGRSYSRSRSRSRSSSRTRSLSPRRLRGPPPPHAHARSRSRSRTPPTPRRVERYHRLPSRRSLSRDDFSRMRSRSPNGRGLEKGRGVSPREDRYVERRSNEYGRNREREREYYDRRERRTSPDRGRSERERDREHRGLHEERDYRRGERR